MLGRRGALHTLLRVLSAWLFLLGVSFGKLLVAEAEVIDATGTMGTLSLVGRAPSTGGHLAVLFAGNVTPLLKSLKARRGRCSVRGTCVVLERAVLILKIGGDFDVALRYQKSLRKTHEWPIEIEWGLELVQLLDLSDAGAKLQRPLSDRMAIPDFSSLFLAYAISGTIMCGYMSCMVKWMGNTY